MNRVVIDLDALRHNLQCIVVAMRKHGASWSVVTKALCGHEDTIRALHLLGTRCFADSRLDNLRAIEKIAPGSEKWYLRLPPLSSVEQVVEFADASLNTEVEVITALSKEACKIGKNHHVIIMIELGDLREGILPGSLIKFYQTVFNLPNIEVLGLGAQVGCLSGAAPSLDQISQLLLYRELLELKFQHKLPLISAGTSIALSLLMDGALPRSVNHFRIGEALFLGTNLLTGGTLPGLRSDVVMLESEIAEIKKKSLVPSGEMVNTPFEKTPQGEEDKSLVGQRGYRALVTIGQLDTDVGGLTPVNPKYKLAGASSDITVVNLGSEPDGLGIGDKIQFRPNYSAFVRLMNDSYIKKEVRPDLENFARNLPANWTLDVPPILSDSERN